MGKMRAENGASPGKWNQRLGPAENGWFCFDPYPGVNKGTKGNQELLNKGTKILEIWPPRASLGFLGRDSKDDERDVAT